MSVAGSAPSGRTFQVQFGKSRNTIYEADWSAWMTFDRTQAATAVSTYPATYIPEWPVVLHIQLGGVSDPTIVQAELRFEENGDTKLLQWRAFGPALGFLLWRERVNQTPQAATMAVYNRRYWAEFNKTADTKIARPKHFVVIDRFIGGDDDRLDWQEGVENLSQLGVTALMLPPGKVERELLAESGLKTASAVYSPPGYAFAPQDVAGKRAESPTAWAAAQAKPYVQSGFALNDITWLAMSDEPGWYYPSQYSMLSDTAALERFHAYLNSNGLQPSDLGRSDWGSITPIGRSQVGDLSSKRLFYWTQRFFSWDSSRYFAECTRELEQAFYPGILVATNWNFFSGRLYVPGPVANNPEKRSPEAAMGGQDWLEFGRMRAGTVLWTEDWFPDHQAYQWSFYAAKLRSAAAEGNITFGGYVVPRASGDREDGLLQKVLTLVGSGAKAMQTYVFGPEYNFPGNCYSDIPHILPRLAEAYRVITSAEEVLWPGKTPSAEVAVLAPRNSELWDQAGESAITTQISDATNTDLNAHTVDYMAEVADLYLAFQRADIPVDFIEEDDLTPERLSRYRAVYMTEPDIPREYQEGLVSWVKGGGTLVSVSNAGSMNRYDERSDVLQTLEGATGNRRSRLLIKNLESISAVGTVARDGRRVTAWGARTRAETRAAQWSLGSMMHPLRLRSQKPEAARSHISRGCPEFRT